MKQLLLLLSLFTLLTARAQIQIINRNLTDSSLNLVYTDIPNHLVVKGLDRAELSSTVGEISRNGNEFRIVIGHECEFQLSVLRNGRKLLTQKFRAATFPEPVVALGGQTDTARTRTQILLNPFLSIIYPHSYLKYPAWVISFTARFWRNSGDSVVTEAVGSDFTYEQVQIAKTLTSGDMVLFENIYGSCAGGVRRHFPSFIIHVK